MLEAVEVLAGPRGAMRRAVDFSCDVACDVWDEILPHRATNLSPQGIWLETDYPLHVGTEVVLAFDAPRTDRRVLVYGDVRRVEMRRRATERKGAGMGISFEYLSQRDRDLLAEVLRGLPPPLPPRRAPRVGAGVMRPPESPREMVWVDMLLTYEEDLGDRVNVVEISDEVTLDLDEEIVFSAAGDLLTASRPPEWWLH